MKTKWIILVLTLACCNFYASGQEQSFSCGTKEIETVKEDTERIGREGKGGTTITTTTTTTSSSNSCGSEEVTFLKINIHFMMNNSGDGPGNFTQMDDGLGNMNFTGFDYANRLVVDMKKNWARNYQVIRWPGSKDNPPTEPPAMLPKMIQVSHMGTYFHWVNNEVYNTLSIVGDDEFIIDNYGVNVGEEINIFLMERSDSDKYGGTAYTDINGLGTILYNAWDNYQNNLPADAGTYDMARTANHEIGHMLGLNHTFCDSHGCDDIDTEQEACYQDCKPCWGSNSNNLMAYVEMADALTPCQIGKAINNLEDLESYVDYCCDDWSINDISCPTCNIGGTPLPGISVETECTSTPGCFNFDIIQTEYTFSESLRKCEFSFELKGAAEQLACNEWKVAKFKGNIMHDEKSYTNQSTLNNITVSENFRLQICVTACGEECEDFTKCITISCVDSFWDGNGEERSSEQNPNDLKEKGINIYPNPFNNHVEINAPENSIDLIIMYDNLGRLIQELTFTGRSELLINTEKLNHGIYWLQVQHADGTQSIEKILKLN